MNIDEFSRLYPEYAFDFNLPIGRQPRVYEPSQLEQFPPELNAVYAYRSGGRGRPNLNQTKTHAQCATCKRVLRNDQFYAPPSLRRRNVIFPHCLACSQERNAEQYATGQLTTRSVLRRIRLFLGSTCTACGFSADVSAIDLHHSKPKLEKRLEGLIESVASAKQPQSHAEELLKLARQSRPLCANCHRMHHAGALSLPDEDDARHYDLAAFIQLLNAR